MAISDWMPVMKAKLAEISGLDGGVRDYTDLPGALGEGPIGILLPRSARHVYNAGGPAVWLHQLQFTIYQVQQPLDEAYSQLVPFIKRVRDKMAANVQLGGLSWSGGSVAHWLPLPEADFYDGPGYVAWGRTEGTANEYLGIIFRMELKEVETGVTVTP